MAYVKIIPIHKTPERCLKYVAKKCEYNQIQGINCSTFHDIANAQFNLTQEMFNNDNYKNKNKQKVLAHHIIQSFSGEDNVTLEEAKDIALKTAREHFALDEKNFQIFIATHTDTKHIHNHIVVNSISIDGYKYNSNKESLRSLKKTSDKVCLQYNHKIIQNIKKNKTTSVPYNEWDLNRKGYSWKDKLSRKIDKAILVSSDIESVITNLEKENIECKILKDSKGENYLGIRNKGFNKFFVNTKNLSSGDDYTLEKIVERCQSVYKLPIIERKPRNIKIVKRHKNKRYKYSKYFRSTRKFNTSNYILWRRSRVVKSHKNTLKKIIKLLTQDRLIQKKYNNDKPYTIRNDIIINTLAEDFNIIKKYELHSMKVIETKQMEFKNNIESCKNKISKINNLNNAFKKVISTLKNIKELKKLNDNSYYENNDLKNYLQRSDVKEVLKKYSLEDLQSVQARNNNLQKLLKEERGKIKLLVEEQTKVNRIKERYLKIEKGEYINNLIKYSNKNKKNIKNR